MSLSSNFIYTNKYNKMSVYTLMMLMNYLLYVHVFVYLISYLMMLRLFLYFFLLLFRDFNLTIYLVFCCCVRGWIVFVRFSCWNSRFYLFGLFLSRFWWILAIIPTFCLFTWLDAYKPPEKLENIPNCHSPTAYSSQS